MNSKTIKGYSSSVAILFFFITPLLSLPYVVKGVAKGQRSAFLLVSIFMGLIAFLTIPLNDLYRHTMNYFHMVDGGIEEILMFQGFDDFLILLLTKLLVILHLPFEYLRFFEILYCYFLFFSIFRFYIYKNSYSEKQTLWRFFIIILFFEFVYTTTGLRYGLAICNYFYGIHLFFDRKQILKSLFFFILSVISHLSFGFFIPISFIFALYATSFRKSIIGVMIVFVLGNIFIGNIANLMSVRADWYFSGGNSLSGEGYSNLTINGMLMLLLPRLCLLPFLILAIKESNHGLWWKRFFYSWLLLVGTFITNSIVLLRAFWGLEYASVFMLLDIERFSKMKDSVIKQLLLCGICFTFFNAIDFKVYIINSHYERLFLPVPVILTYTYSYEWVTTHIDNNEIIRPIE